MSDDEEVPYTRRNRTIHYGSLEEQERQRAPEDENSTPAGTINASEGIAFFSPIKEGFPKSIILEQLLCSNMPVKGNESKIR